ncbi:MAG: hypothetical protein ACI4B6_04340 [Atopobiaceae bacterium]
MKKKELTLLLVLSLAAVGAVLGVTAMKAYGDYQRKSRTTDNVDPIVIPAGDTWTFNSNDPQNNRVNDQGMDYLYELGWSGTMEMTILGAKAYANADALDADVPEELAAQMKSRGSDDKRGLLLVTLKQRNVDAIPNGEILDSNGNPVLSACVFTIPDAEPAYFSEATAPDNDHDYLEYSLSSGEEKTMVLGYWYGQLDGTTSNQPPAVMQPGNDGQFKPYKLQLGTTLVGGNS